MAYMFQNTTAFNQNLANWDVSGITDATNSEDFATNAGFDACNKKAIYNTWIVEKKISLWNWNSIATWDNPQGLSGENCSNLHIPMKQTELETAVEEWLESYHLLGGTTYDFSYNLWNAQPSSFWGYISGWNVSECTSGASLFSSYPAPNYSLHVKNVIRDKFNDDISNWDTGKFNTMAYMFQGATAFNGNISNWNTGNVTNMNNMFNSANAFNRDLFWNTEKLQDMSGMFYSAIAFNRDLERNGNIWNTENVTDMNHMFYLASKFNGNISNWNTGNVENMEGMFQYTSAFNRHLSWNTLNVENMANMFYYATQFNQNLANWDVSGITNEIYSKDFASYAGFNACNKKAIYNSWIVDKKISEGNWSKIQYVGNTYESIRDWSGANIVC